MKTTKKKGNPPKTEGRSAPKRTEKPFRLVVTKEGKTPKSSPYAKSHPHMTEMRVEMVKKPFRLEVGKTYENKSGSIQVKIERESGGIPLFPMVGKVLSTSADKPCFCKWTRTGGYLADMDCPYDLVREVSKPSQSRKARAK